MKILFARKNGKTNTVIELIKKCKNTGDPLDCAFCKYNMSKECKLYKHSK